MDHREGKFDVTLTREPRQAMPTAHDFGIGADGQVNCDSVIRNRGDADRLGETIDEESAPQDDNYPSMPTSEIDGNTDVDFNSVAPFKYPDFGDWPIHKTGFDGALRSKGEYD